MPNSLRLRLLTTPCPQPLGPVAADPLGDRPLKNDTKPSELQAHFAKNLCVNQVTRRSGAENYTHVTFVPIKIACMVAPMDATRALNALAAMSERETITQPEAADALGVSVATIARREKNGWELTELLSLADAFGISRTRLMLQLGYLDDTDLFSVIGDGSLKGVPLSTLTSELHRRAREIGG